MEQLETIECRWCGEFFYLCRRCYHGEVYCEQSCRDAARKKQCCKAQQNYMATENGQERRSAAVAAYRARQREERIEAVPQSPKTVCNRSRSIPLRSSMSSLPQRACCRHCGRLGQVLSPFLR